VSSDAAERGIMRGIEWRIILAVAGHEPVRAGRRDGRLQGVGKLLAVLAAQTRGEIGVFSGDGKMAKLRQHGLRVG
jgi:hypothetical protein